MKKLIIDLDDTICTTINSKYTKSLPNIPLIEKIKEYKDLGFTIVINTSRNMRSHEGNIGKINKLTLPIIIKWLDKYNVIYDEIHVGKPWCGTEGFYIDDKSIRPSEFVELTYDEIINVLNKEIK